MALAAALGFAVDRFAIRNRSNKEAADAMLKDTKEAYPHMIVQGAKCVAWGEAT